MNLLDYRISSILDGIIKCYENECYGPILTVIDSSLRALGWTDSKYSGSKYDELNYWPTYVKHNLLNLSIGIGVSDILWSDTINVDVGPNLCIARVIMLNNGIPYQIYMEDHKRAQRDEKYMEGLELIEKVLTDNQVI